MSLIDEALDGLGRFMRQIRERGLEFTSGRYYSKYMGIVLDTNDPQGQGRVLVSAEVVNGRSDPIQRWAYPSAEYAGRDKGVFMPPDVGDAVWVWFDHGDRTQPRYSGAFWGNPAQVKTSETSHVPAEFKTGGAVTTRGLKTKAGHGMLFEDDATKRRRVEVWTGDQVTPGAEATKHHRVVMIDADGEQEILIQSFGGQSVSLKDVANQQEAAVRTNRGLFARLIDHLQRIVLGGPLGYRLTLDETTGQIRLETPAGNRVELLEQAQTINIQDSFGSVVSLTPAGVNILSAAAVNVKAAATVNVAAGAQAAITAAGAVSVAGAGLSLASTGGGPSSQTASGVTNNSFVGLKTEELAGGLVQIIIGLWQVTSTIVSIVSPAISLGTVGTKFVLMDSRFIALFNAHTHNAIGIGLPTGPPLTPATIGLHTTTALSAN